jgi:hypothetical protein
MLTSRERVRLAIHHQEPDRVPVDLGSLSVTGMHVSTIYKLRQTLGLDPPGTPIKVIEPYQMLGEIKADLADTLGVDVVGFRSNTTAFGFKNEGWKPWTFFDGTPLLVPAGFNTEPDPNGDLLMYPAGDRSVPASGRMPKDGFYFDSIIRQEPFEEESLRWEDNTEEFAYVSESSVEYFRAEAERLFRETERAVVSRFGDSSFGDIAKVPGPSLKHPKGIRDIEEWYISLKTRRDYIYKVFERQCEITLANLERTVPLVRDQVMIAYVSGTDFGQQNGPFISPSLYRSLFMPFHKQINDYIHKHTAWKTFMHCCGSVYALLNDFIEAGFDILNPVQTSAVDMEPARLKREFGDRIVFWGGGVDTQRTLPFGTPDQVREEVRDRIRAFGAGGGFVFCAIHNIQARTPVENVLAMFEAVREYGNYLH